MKRPDLRLSFLMTAIRLVFAFAPAEVGFGLTIQAYLKEPTGLSAGMVQTMTVVAIFALQGPGLPELLTDLRAAFALRTAITVILLLFAVIEP